MNASTNDAIPSKRKGSAVTRPSCSTRKRGRSSRTGLRPGNHESAGKRLSGRTRLANRTLRQALVESARGAVRKRDPYLAAQYRRLVKRRGDKKAIVAVAHSILVAIWHMLRQGVDYHELGATHFDQIQTQRLVRHHLRRLEELGLQVTINTPGAAA